MRNELCIIDVSEAIIRKLFKTISEPSGGIGYRVDHSLRVKKYLEIFLLNPEISKFNLDQDIVISAGILHDIGDLARVKNSVIDYSVDIDHAKIGPKYVTEAFAGYNFDPEKVQKICSIIENHHNYNSKLDIETKLVQDADLLEEVGTLNVWQMFGYSMSKQRSLKKTLLYWLKEGKARKEKCIKQLNFAFTRKCAVKRMKRLDQFLSGLASEAEGKDL